VADRRIDDEGLIPVVELVLFCYVGGIAVGLLGSLTIGRG
jgi:hypothetical protein